ncbi:S26 family signal peptidase [Ferrovibrio sp.]|jgi:conjugative transfer signal peptidase TraF|uniref:S26 family signal peptidase n=1 Tax=Ferrovibrio sp. TaxID=1917215 RepID=UPI001BB97261|nr:S26 family signal peptidase [Ferrovibrio sp.]MBS4047009.1 S26 family signal peptidase [Alphaproteobacteria bacterium]
MVDLKLALGGSLIGCRRLHARRYRRRVLTLTLLGLAALGAAVGMPKHPLLVWNASASAPFGLYRLAAMAQLQRGAWLLVRLSDSTRRMAATRGYLPADIPLIKPVAAVPGEVVCAAGDTVWLASGLVLQRLVRDGQGRLLPAWYGCRIVADDEVFLANPAILDSFDSRYLGPVPRTSVIGQLVPLWTW